MFLYKSKRVWTYASTIGSENLYSLSDFYSKDGTSNGFCYQLWRKLFALDDILVKDGFDTRNGMSSFFTAFMYCLWI